MPGDTPVLVFVADDNYTLPLAAAIASVTANLASEGGLQIFVINGEISQTNKQKLLQFEKPNRVGIEWLEPSESHCVLLKSLPCGYVGRACYYKILIPELLGPGYRKIIFLDSDVIVEADITDLWDTSIGENYVLAVQDVINPRVSSPFGLRNWRELGRRADEELFNTGVLVINVTKWRNENISRMLVEYLHRHYQFIQLCDQDAMNAVFQNRWGQLDARWNVLPFMNIASGYCLLSRKSHDQLLMQARILHFCGPGKPWSARCTHPRKERFFHYLDMTAWSGWRPARWPVNRDFFTYYYRRVRVALRRTLSKTGRQVDFH